MESVIPLPNGKVVLVDAGDLEMLSHWSWTCGVDCYVTAYNGGGLSGRRIVSMHRLLMLPAPGFHVDHVNHNKLDNRRANLRICTRSQNNMNQLRIPKNTSGFKGVSWSDPRRKWRARIKLDGRECQLGYFDDKADAARCYDSAARETFGEFALANFPQAN